MLAGARLTSAGVSAVTKLLQFKFGQARLLLLASFSHNTFKLDREDTKAIGQPTNTCNNGADKNHISTVRYTADTKQSHHGPSQTSLPENAQDGQQQDQQEPQLFFGVDGHEDQ